MLTPERIDEITYDYRFSDGSIDARAFARAIERECATPPAEAAPAVSAWQLSDEQRAALSDVLRDYKGSAGNGPYYTKRIEIIENMLAARSSSSVEDRQPATPSNRYSWAVDGMRHDPEGDWVLAGSQPAAATEQEPVAMILICPRCGTQHIDAPDEISAHGEEPADVWTNPPHRSHLCRKCGTIWRPADVATTGVATIETHGKADTWQSPAALLASITTPAPVGDSGMSDELPVNINDELHPDTAKLVRRFARSLANKLLVAQRKYGYGASWADDDWQDKCRADLMNHIAKGDPRDVAAYCAFMWHHDWPTAAPVGDSASQPAEGKRMEMTGWKLAMRVLQSDLYRELADDERSECDLLIRSNPAIARAASDNEDQS